MPDPHSPEEPPAPAGDNGDQERPTPERGDPDRGGQAGARPRPPEREITDEDRAWVAERLEEVRQVAEEEGMGDAFQELATINQKIENGESIDEATQHRGAEIGEQLNENPRTREALEIYSQQVRARRQGRSGEENDGSGRPDVPPDENAQDDPNAFDYEVLSDTFRRELSNKYKLNKANTELAWRYSRDPGSLTPQERAVIEPILRANPELPERLVRETEHAVPATTSDGTPPTEDQQKAYRDTQERIRQDREAIDVAMRAAQDHPDDMVRQQAAIDALQEAREHAQQHDADHLDEGDPVWSHLLKALGIAFYMYIGLQYAVASAVRGMAKNGGR